MRMRFLTGCAMLAVGAVAASPSMAAPTILNGSFEINAGSIPTGGFTTVFATNSTTIADWTVTQGSVDWVGTYWQAAQGIASIDLSGDGEGKITQTITGLTKGDEYEISFWLAGNPDGGPGGKTGTIKVTANGTAFKFDYPVTDQTHSNMDWVPETFDLPLLGEDHAPSIREHHEFGVRAGHRQRRYNFYSGSIDLGHDAARLHGAWLCGLPTGAQKSTFRLDRVRKFWSSRNMGSPPGGPFFCATPHRGGHS